MKAFRYITAMTALACLAGCASIKSICRDEEESIPLSSVPQVVLHTAGSTLEGFEAVEASVEKEDGLMVYELKGRANDTTYEMNITADGHILRLKREDDD